MLFYKSGTTGLQSYLNTADAQERIEALRQKYSATQHDFEALLSIAAELLPEDSDFLDSVRQRNFRAMCEILNENGSLFDIFGPQHSDQETQEHLMQQCAIAGYLNWRISELPRIRESKFLN